MGGSAQINGAGDYEDPREDNSTYLYQEYNYFGLFEADSYKISNGNPFVRIGGEAHQVVYLNENSSIIDIGTNSSINAYLGTQSEITLDADFYSANWITQYFTLIADPGEWYGMPVTINLNTVVESSFSSGVTGIGINGGSDSLFYVEINNAIVATGAGNAIEGVKEFDFQLGALVGDSITFRANSNSFVDINSLISGTGINNNSYTEARSSIMANMNAIPVPENNTFILMLFGIGLVSYYTRKRESTTKLVV